MHATHEYVCRVLFNLYRAKFCLQKKPTWRRWRPECHQQQTKKIRWWIGQPRHCNAKSYRYGQRHFIFSLFLERNGWHFLLKTCLVISKELKSRASYILRVPDIEIPTIPQKEMWLAYHKNVVCSKQYMKRVRNFLRNAEHVSGNFYHTWKGTHSVHNQF